MADSPETTNEPVKKGFGLIGLIKAVVVVTLIVVVEVGAASVFIPTAQDAESTARKVAAAEEGDLEDEDAKAKAKAQEAALLAEKSTLEANLGLFNVTRYNPENDTTLIVDFELFGVVLSDDESDFFAQFERNKVRFREQVIMTLGSADSTDLTDPELALLKRRILEKTNRALGKPLVQEVLFSKFNFVER
ncbi:flagellar basal body-associated FliL family protein [Aeoliella mucimassa]|uniref:Flagellar protein FliL n=1 Tax=Aeoliella mucimassa TaxID=2527972 RepID=A0A518AKQ5_9BACT|nr:flagellar basal body-associated FliL family protein [Aeoliella mucimassa]QDU55309.1 Flagellar basal body-associated protein FliL [Aeoliella mucimassa]